MKSSFVIGKVKGIDIEINLSWIVIFALLTYTLATNYLPSVFDGIETTTAWLISGLMAVLFFTSVLLHELSHSIVANGLGVEVKRITLFIFGGLAQMEKDVDQPVKELKIAIAGPAMSVFLSILFYGAGTLMDFLELSLVFREPAYYLSTVNLILAVFNLVPAFPLDGGRVLRAILWKATGDRKKATRITSGMGSFFGYLLIFNGIFLAFGGNVFNGLWMLFIGWFITQAAQTGYQQVLMDDIFNKICVKEFMTKNVVSVEYHVNLADLVEEYFLRYKYSIFPVIRINDIMGIVSLNEIKKVDRTLWAETTVASVAYPLNDNLVVSPSDCVSKAMDKAFKNNVGRVLVMEGGELLGIVSKTDILNYLRIQSQIGGMESDTRNTRN
ncbi:site-2 protease family protein [Alkalibacter mobilis]|uniref:site-2 protease family protein n=1 Tax=Alkalibacter mobilis TaxID=2787712 RepID=UPI00189CEEBB|nr:site-2 protease family protein [Alkalibacter mobilis]MBF7096050.1 site-2 protease family protein [Alkalibacter mobilis]